jgi:uncharacterized SAM-binding protein YcdF (DUF218 family)
MELKLNIMALTFMEIWLISLVFLTGIIILVVTLQLNAALKKLTHNPAAPQAEQISCGRNLRV